MARWPPLRESMIVIQTLTLDDLMPSVNISKIDGASASVNEKLKASTGTIKLAASTHTNANNYFKNLNSVLARWPSLKGMTTAVATSKNIKIIFMSKRYVLEEIFITNKGFRFNYMQVLALTA